MQKKNRDTVRDLEDQRSRNLWQETENRQIKIKLETENLDLK